MHIVFFNRAYFPEVSATSQLLTELTEGLAREHGCQISVVAGMPQGTPSKGWQPPKGWGIVRKERAGQILILRAWGTRWSKRTLLGRIANYLTYFASSCWATLHLNRPDVVIALTDPPVVGLAALLAAHRFGCPLVISYRDLFPEVSRLIDGKCRPFIEWALHRVNRILIHCASRIIALGEDMRQRLISEKGAHPDQVVIIPDWADTTLISPSPKRNRFSLEQGVADRFVVMHSGNIGLSQNLGVVVEAMGELRDLPNLMFLIVGDGVQKEALQEQVRGAGLQNVRFLSYQPRDVMAQSYATADCFIVSLKPGLAGYITPSKLYGILAAGRPYVAAVEPSCDVARVTQKYRCGLLARPEDPSDIAEKIRRFHADPNLARELGANARKASEDFSQAKGVLEYFRLCQELRYHTAQTGGRR